MSTKTVPVSVRLSHEDAEFISGLKINGANTPSDKLRAIIGEKRRKSATAMDYQGCFQEIHRYMEPALEIIRKMENDQGVHSEIVTRSFEWLPDLIAYIVSMLSIDQEEHSPDYTELERGLADRLFRVMETVLQMGTTKWCHCYDPETMAKRSEPVLDLAGLITALKNRTMEE